MVTTLLFAGVTALLLCFFTMIAEDFMHYQKRKASFSSSARLNRSRANSKQKSN